MIAHKTIHQMLEGNQQNPNKHDSNLSDSDTSDDEPINPSLNTSNEENHYDTIHSSAIATHVTLSYSTAQENPTVEQGPARKVTIKKLPKEKAEHKETQTDKSEKKTQ